MAASPTPELANSCLELVEENKQGFMEKVLSSNSTGFMVEIRTAYEAAEEGAPVRVQTGGLPNPQPTDSKLSAFHSIRLQ